MKKKENNIKLSYESDGKMGKEKKDSVVKKGESPEETFFNITQNSE
ncbi:hypothetical protein J2Z40_000434 [Cytobacillus eiseniae]|uniref:Uncharacterized protein n=1 Tax=Cytobacillus eiseniae TaxID=762947 RepID=A0ABS4RAF7_9BACI|nr:hypothetical protein [Cytobacillus eiseniae]MBP2239881.1 hypothetical protein [Cytobacillus eiseniae]